MKWSWLIFPRCHTGEGIEKECYALLIANITSLSSTYKNYNQSEVEEAFEKFNCSSETTDPSSCPGASGHPPPPIDTDNPFLCERCQALESSTADWKGPTLTDQEYGALLTRNAAG